MLRTVVNLANTTNKLDKGMYVFVLRFQLRQKTLWTKNS